MKTKKSMILLTALSIGMFTLAGCGDDDNSIATTSSNSSTPIVTHTVSFDVNGGIGTIPSQTCEEGTYALEPTIEVTKAHYELVGWTSVKNDETTMFEFASTPINGDITLYAFWEINTHTINFYLNYLEGEEDLYQTYTASYGTLITEPEAKPTRNDHYNFDKWYFDKECTEPVEFDTAIIDKNTDLFAGWDIEQVKVSFETFGGAFESQENLDERVFVNVDYGTSVTKPSSNPERLNAEFENWYEDELCTVLFDFDSVITSETVIYAGYNTGFEVLTAGIDISTGAIVIENPTTDFEISELGLGFIHWDKQTMPVQRGQLFMMSLSTIDLATEGYDDVSLRFEVYRENESGVMEWLSPLHNAGLVALKLVSDIELYGGALAGLTQSLMQSDVETALSYYTEMEKMYDSRAPYSSPDDGGFVNIFQLITVGSAVLGGSFKIELGKDYRYPMNFSVSQPGKYCLRIWLETKNYANDIAFTQVDFTAID